MTGSGWLTATKGFTSSRTPRAKRCGYGHPSYGLVIGSGEGKPLAQARLHLPQAEICTGSNAHGPCLATPDEVPDLACC
jgi:hypothetical protein